MSSLLTNKKRNPQLVTIGHLYRDGAKQTWVVTGYDYGRRAVFIARDENLCTCGAADLGMVWEAEIEAAQPNKEKAEG